MNEMNNSPGCERASDLIAFLYNEASEHERRDFESHLQQCSSCSQEIASFGVVRKSITTWRDEVLSGFVATPVPSEPRRKSALAAFREFFDLSPLWLKGAISFALITLCALAALALFRLPNKNTQVAVADVDKDRIYTAQDVEQMVKDAVAREQQSAQQREDADTIRTREPVKPKKVSQLAKSRRPLTRAEREQLAADLRLLTTADDDELHLLGDRINQ